MLLRYSLQLEAEAAALEAPSTRPSRMAAARPTWAAASPPQQMADEIIDHLPGGFFLGI